MGSDTSTLRMKLAASGRWLALLTLPLLVNAGLWLTVVRPQRAALQTARNAQAVTTLKPKLQALVADSDHVMTDLERTDFTSDDPTKVTQAVQQLAGVHRLHVKTITTTGAQDVSIVKKVMPHATAPSVAGLSTLPIDVEVTGSFGKLAHWVSDLETQSGLQVDSWVMRRSEEGATHSCSMMVKLIAFMHRASAT